MNQIVFQTNAQLSSTSGTIWAAPSFKYFVNWKVEINALASGDNTLLESPDTIVIKGRKTNVEEVFTQELILKDQRVFINFDSKALGDTIAWIPYVEEFRQKHNCKVILSTFYNLLFREQYSEIEFVEPGSVAYNLYAQYLIGCFDNDYTRNKNNWREIPLQKVAADILGLDYKETRSKVSAKQLPVLGRKYVCISDHSTMQAKYWNYPGGWQQIVDYLGDLGYDVIALSKDATGLKKLVPINNREITEITSILNNCEFFIGVGSGLSWLAWALNKKVIMISGFSDPFAEFTLDNYRLSPPPGICHGCFNDINCTFDRSWEWCPRNKDYECSRTITPEMVKDKINLLITHL
jgi:autotransporter strand-loop-strand O-heptosyltransferase